MKTFFIAITLLLVLACGYADDQVAGTGQETVYKAPLDVATGRPMVNLMINDKGPYPFIFDTGSSVFSVTSVLANELDLEITGKTEVGSPGGGLIPVDMVNLNKVDLAGSVIMNVEALLIDTGMSTSAHGYGVFGPAIFSDFGRVAFDFENYVVEIGGEFTTPDDANWIEFGQDAPLLDVIINLGGMEMHAHIDTGNPSVIMAPKEHSDSLPLTSEVEVVGKARTVDGPFEILGASMQETLMLGDAKIPLEKITFYNRSHANVGMGGLHNLVLEIDWKRNRYAISGVAKPKELRRRRSPGPTS